MPISPDPFFYSSLLLPLRRSDLDSRTTGNTNDVLVSNSSRSPQPQGRAAVRLRPEHLGDHDRPSGLRPARAVTRPDEVRDQASLRCSDLQEDRRAQPPTQTRAVAVSG